MATSKNVLVTGANGFIGKSVVNRLINSGHNVSVLTRDKYHHPSESVSHFTCDLTRNLPDPTWLEAQDVLIHLAAKVKNAKTHEPVEQSLNAAIALNMSRAISRSRIPRVLVLSSIAAKVATQNPTSARRYGLEKAYADEIFLNISAPRTCIALMRIPAVYGADMVGSLATLSNLVRKGLPLPLGSAITPRPYMSLINLTDLISCMVDAKQECWDKIDKEPFEAHDGKMVSTAELVKHLAIINGKNSLLIPFPVSLLRAIGNIAGMQDQISGALDSVPCEQSPILSSCFDWQPKEQIPDSLSFMQSKSI